MKFTPWAAVLVIAAGPAAAWDLDTITVTGTRVEKRLADTPVATEIITADEIKATGATDLKQLLSAYGLITNAATEHGDQLSVEGLGGSRVLVLIDGRRVPGRVAQNIEGDSVPLVNVERVEIVRGPQSALYGSDAMGGVINIITRRPSGTKLSLTADNTSISAYDDPQLGGAGEYPGPLQKQQLQLGLETPVGDWLTSLQLAGTRADYYWDQRGEVSVLPRLWRGSVSLEADHGTPATGLWTLGGSAAAIDQVKQIDFTGTLEKRQLQRYEAFARWRTEGTGSSWEVQGYQHVYRRSTDLGGPQVESLSGLEAWHTRDLTDSNTLTLGIQATLDALNDETLSSRGSFSLSETAALIAQDEQYQDGLYSVVSGLRLEYGSGFGLFTAPKVAAQYTLAPGWRVLGGAGMGYRVPSVQDRFTDIDVGWEWHPIVLGNKALKPEYSLAANAGAEWVPGSFLSGRVNAYHQELFDEITYVQTGASPDGRAIFRNENRVRTSRTGADVELAVAPLDHWTIEGAYGWLLAWDREAETALTEDPAHRVRGALGYRNQPWGLSARVDGQWDSNRRLFVLGASFSQDWGNGLGVYARADNLTSALDKARGPFTPVSLTLGLRYQTEMSNHQGGTT